MKFTEALREALIDEVVGVQGSYGASFEEDDPPEVEIKTNIVGDWIWVHSEADYEGATWDRTTDRASGDPYSAHVIHDWIGTAEAAPKSVSSFEELKKWALVHTKIEREYTDVGVWGVQSGRWVDSVSPEGNVQFSIVSARSFQDVSPQSQTSPNQIDLHLFEVISFDNLIQLLEHENDFVREIAANQLGKLGDTRAVDPFLVKATKDESRYVRETAIEALGKLGGEKAIERLISIVIESSRYVYESPKRALIDVGEPGLPFLAPRITSEEKFVSIAIIEIIEQIGGTQSGQVLVDALVEKRPAVRARIIEALPKFGDLQVFDALIEDLHQGEYEVRLKAAWALGRFQDVRAIEALQAVLVDDDGSVRRMAAEALEELGWQPSTDGETSLYLYARREWDDLALMGMTAVETIILALKDADARSSILSALKEAEVSLDDRRVVKLLVRIFDSEDTRDYRRREAIRVLARTGLSQAIPPIIRIYMTEETEYLAKPAFEALGYLAASGAPVAKKLVQILTKNDPEMFDAEEIKAYLKLFTVIPASQKQITAIATFLKFVIEQKIKGVTKTAKDLLRIVKLHTDLSEDDRATRDKAVKAIGKTGLPSAAIHLLHALEDEYPVIRKFAAKTLGNLGEGVLSLLLDALSSKHLNVRIGVIEALGMIRDARATKPLLEIIDHEHRIIRQNTAWALGNLYIYRERYFILRGEVISVLENAMLTDDYVPVRINATHAMAEFADSSDLRSVDPLLKALFDPESKVRYNASYGIMRVVMNKKSFRENESPLRERVVDKLIVALSDEIDDVRYTAVESLRYLGGDKAMTALIAVRNDDDEKMRKLVERAITEIKTPRRGSWAYQSFQSVELRNPDDIEGLIQALGDKKKSVRLSAEIALGEMGHLAFDRCIEILQDKSLKWHVREGVAGTLGRIRDSRAVDALIEALSDEHKMVRGNAAWSLAELKDKRSLKALLKATKDEYWAVRANAIAGACRIGGSAAFEALLRLLKDEHPRVRLIATSYLAQFKSPRVIPALKKQLKDDDAEVRDMAKSWYDHLMKKKGKK